MIVSSSGINRKDYKNYLCSEKWKSKRKTILNRDGRKCTNCSRNTRLHIHHLTYVRFSNESDDDLITLCDFCHAEIHGHKIPKHYNKTKKFNKIRQKQKSLMLTASEAKRRRCKTNEFYTKKIKYIKYSNRITKIRNCKKDMGFWEELRHYDKMFDAAIRD